MGGTQDSSTRSLGAEGQAQGQNQFNNEMHEWLNSLGKLMDAVEKSPMDAARKNEILTHINIIRGELEGGNWPETAEARSALHLAEEVGEFEKMAQDWQVLSMRIANWVKAVSDSLGVR